MITFAQALTERYFHEEHSNVITVGPRGGRTEPKVFEWRRNGKTKTWKTRPGEFSIPVKFGLYAYGSISHHDADRWHIANECPLIAARSALR
jgi:hypothetical protein